MKQFVLKFYCREHCYKTIVFSSYNNALAYLIKEKPLGTDKIEFSID